MCDNVIFVHVQNMTNHRGDDMHGHFKHRPLTTFNYVKLHFNTPKYSYRLIVGHISVYLFRNYSYIGQKVTLT